MILASEIRDKLTMDEYCAAALANLLGVTIQTINKWRVTGRYIPEAKKRIFLEADLSTSGTWVFKKDAIIEFYVKWLDAVA